MLNIYQQIGTSNATAQAGTNEWLAASKNMILSAYVGDTVAISNLSPTSSDELNRPQPFGTHLKEALKAWGLR